MKKSLSLILCLALAMACMPTAWAAKNAKVIIEPQYDDISHFQEGLAFVLKDELWGVIDEQGTVIVKPKYDSLYDGYYEFREGLARVELDWQWGFINKKGEEIIPLKYDWVSHFSEGLAVVSVGEKYGYIDPTGNMVIQPIYDDATVFENGVAIVIDDYEKGKISLIDKTGKKIADTPYFNESSMFEDVVFNEGLFWVSNDAGLVGAIDRTGRVVIELKYDYPGDVLLEYDTYHFYEGVAVVGKNLQRSLINTKGEVIAKLTKYDGNPNFTIGDFVEGLAGIYLNDKYGFIDLTGKEVVPPIYDYAYSFSEGIAAVYQNGKFGFIDKSGKEIVKPKYEEVGFMQNGRAAVRLNGKWGFIDATGNEVIKPEYEDWYLEYLSAYMFEEGLAFVKKGNHFGYIDPNGKEVIPFQYDDAWYFDKGLAAVNVKGKWGVIALPVDEPSDWAKAEIEAAVALELIPESMLNGYEDNITRADFSKLIIHLLSVKNGKTADELLIHYGKIIEDSVFTDTQDETVLAANALGIVSGKGNGKFDPDGNITRQEAAAMLTRTAGLLELKSDTASAIFADDKRIADWAKDSVAFVASVQDKSNGAWIMGGTGNNKFSPDGTYTRQQAFITMKRLFNAL